MMIKTRKGITNRSQKKSYLMLLLFLEKDISQKVKKQAEKLISKEVQFHLLDRSFKFIYRNVVASSSRKIL